MNSAPTKVPILKGLQNAMNDAWQKFFTALVSAITTAQADITTLETLPYALVSNNSIITIPNTTYTKVTFDTLNYDADSLWDAANNRFIIPSAALVSVKANVFWDTNTTNDRDCTFYLNGAVAPGLAYDKRNSVTNTSVAIQGEIECSSNDYFEVYVYQNSGAARTLRPSPSFVWFSIRVLKWL